MSESDDVRRSLERLVALGRTPDVNIRPVLLRILVDFFVRKSHHSPGELAQFTEIAQGLLDESDPETRLVVAERLSRCSMTPQVFIDRFLDQGGPGAAAMLMHARVDPRIVLASAAQGASEMATAVARRADLDPEICRVLSDRPEREVIVALAGNASAPLDRPVMQNLIRRAKGDEELSRLLLARPAEPIDLTPLFLLATVDQRAAIMVAARRDDLGPEIRRPSLTREQANALARVERSLLSAEGDSFDSALAAALNLPLDEVWRLIDDPHGEPLAVALAAIGASPEFAARVFILNGPAIGHSVMAVRSLIGIVESLSLKTAARLFAAMTHLPARASRAKPHPEPDLGTSRRRAGSDKKPIPLALPRVQRRHSANR